MATFEKKPPLFEALQFDGTEQSAIGIIQGVNQVAPTWMVRYLPAMSEYAIENDQVVEKPQPQRLKLVGPLGNEISVLEGYWVVVDRDGNLEVLSTSTFNELYQPI